MLARDSSRSFSAPRTRPLVAALLGATMAIALYAPSAAAVSPVNVCARTLGLSQARCAQLLHTNRGRRAPSSVVPRAKAGATLVYTSLPFSDTIQISSLDAHGFTPAGALTLPQGSFPLGMTVDQKTGDLYVANSALAGSPGVPSVTVYSPGHSKPIRTYREGSTGPGAVALDAAGTLYVADQINDGNECADTSGDGTVEVYPAGSTSPSFTITAIPGCVRGVGVGADASVYVSYLFYTASGATQSDVMKFAPGSNQGVRLNLQVTGALFYGIAFDAAGNMVVANVEPLGQILTFAPGAQTPKSSIEYDGDGWQPDFYALVGNRVYESAYVAEDGMHVVAVFDYPSGKQRFVQAPSLEPAQYLFGFAAGP
jgi:hypothetical protein